MITQPDPVALQSRAENWRENIRRRLSTMTDFPLEPGDLQWDGNDAYFTLCDQTVWMRNDETTGMIVDRVASQLAFPEVLGPCGYDWHDRCAEVARLCAWVVDELGHEAGVDWIHQFCEQPFSHAADYCAYRYSTA